MIKILGNIKKALAAFPSYGSIGVGCLVTAPAMICSEISHKSNSHAIAALLQQHAQVMDPKLETHLKQKICFLSF